jgi:two-component system response regulator YesN
MKVLIVDDDIATVDVIKSTVDWGKLGIEEVFTAYNILQAKTILTEYSVDIIISDIEMPQGTGIDLLAWFREQQKDGEFLLLTCHESFDYATNAIKLHAAEYLLKPFEPAVTEAALKKIIQKIMEEKQLKENSEYGKWVKNNKRQLKLNVWNMLLDGRIATSQKKNIEDEINNRKLDEDPNDDYHLVISKVTNIEHDRERMNPNLMVFIMENIHSEILCGNPENMNVICYEYKDYYILVTICKGKSENELRSLTKELILELKKVLSSTLTCCISNTCKMIEFYEAYHRVLDLISTNVVYYGDCFLESQSTKSSQNDTYFLELNVMDEMLAEKKKVDFLGYLKKRLNEKVFDKQLNEQLLEQAKQEILQAVYTYLAKRNIQASGLFRDEAYARMTQKASQSVIDILRWTNYILEQMFDYESQLQKSYTIVDRINQFIRGHYMEDIGRNEIAAEFFLAPEYLSKMYKKQTGLSLKDYIIEYRIEQSKILLKKGDMQIGDVAEAVGFENFTYFSTIFKKYTGLSPNQYRKQES